jgi:hypothetical protein
LREAASHLAGQFRFKMLPRPLRDLPELKIDLATWSHPNASLTGFDRLVQSVSAQGNFRLTLTAHDWLAGALSAVELMNRYQRLLPLPNPRPRTRALDAIFEARPAICAAPDAAHDPVQAQDTWRWAIRLCCALPPGTPAGTRLLQDAHDLAFFSSGSLEYLERFGVANTYSKVRRCLSRMSQEAICQALMTRQPALVSQMMEETLVRASWHETPAAERRASA